MGDLDGRRQPGEEREERLFPEGKNGTALNPNVSATDLARPTETVESAVRADG